MPSLIGDTRAVSLEATLGSGPRSGRGGISSTTPAKVSVEERVDRDPDRIAPARVWSTIDSWTLAMSRIGSSRSGTLKIFCRSRTVAPSSIWGRAFRPPIRFGSLA